MKYRAIVLAGACLLSAAAPAWAADANAGAKLTQTNGCMGCHGANFEGGAGPKLFGIEHRLSPAQIAAAISNPKPPMPKFPLTGAQVSDIVAYLSDLDGGVAHAAPVVSLSPASPSNRAELTIRFPGTPPKHVTAQPSMKMGGSSMNAPRVTLSATSDPHVWRGKVTFDMGGAWTIDVNYDGQHISVPVHVTGM